MSNLNEGVVENLVEDPVKRAKVSHERPSAAREKKLREKFGEKYHRYDKIRCIIEYNGGESENTGQEFFGIGDEMQHLIQFGVEAEIPRVMYQMILDAKKHTYPVVPGKDGPGGIPRRALRIVPCYTVTYLGEVEV